MSEQKKSFWSTMPGIITGVAAIISGLAALVPIALGISRSKPAAITSPSATNGGQTASANPGGPSPGSDTTPTSPDPNAPSDTPAGGTSNLTANPASLNVGQARIGVATPEASVSIVNPGPGTATIDNVVISGANASQFSIASTSCGTGTTLASRGSCHIGLRFTAQALGSASASLQVTLRSGQAAVSVALSGTGSLL